MDGLQVLRVEVAFGAVAGLDFDLARSCRTRFATFQLLEARFAELILESVGARIGVIGHVSLNVG